MSRGISAPTKAIKDFFNERIIKTVRAVTMLVDQSLQSERHNRKQKTYLSGGGVPQWLNILTRNEVTLLRSGPSLTYYFNQDLWV